MIVYKLHNKINNKCYIGQTKQTLVRRFYKHSINKSLIGKAIRKYGPECFELTVLHELDSREEILRLEQEEIKNQRKS